MAHLWGIDLGGTKLEGVVLDPANPGQPLYRHRIPTEAEKGYDHILGQIVYLCRELSKETGLPVPEKIGMGTPGVVDPWSGELKNSNTQCLIGHRLKADLETIHGLRFVIANDANCFALAEAKYGAARGYQTVFGVILGTGVGGGIVVDGKVLEGRHGIAGEWGQIVLDPEGPVSNYGTRGTVEAFLSGPGLERFYAGRAGQHRPLREIAEQAAAGSDPHAEATMERLTTRLAQALGIIIDVLDPHAIVLGGGVGNVGALYTEKMREKIAASIFNPRFEAALLKPALGDSAGVFGAAMLVAG
ncbi:MAG TPA: ROK family protein [Candidatus Methylacidiphilales bacterium]|nr:ROK family protein [Candidatus Methylacidiphilales bacterium]